MTVGLYQRCIKDIGVVCDSASQYLNLFIYWPHCGEELLLLLTALCAEEYAASQLFYSPIVFVQWLALIRFENGNGY